MTTCDEILSLYLARMAEQGPVMGPYTRTVVYELRAWAQTTSRDPDEQVAQAEDLLDEVLSALELLNIQMPRNVYQSVCLHTVYDGGCALVKATYTVTGSVASGASISGFTLIQLLKRLTSPRPLPR